MLHRSYFLPAYVDLYFRSLSTQQAASGSPGRNFVQDVGHVGYCQELGKSSWRHSTGGRHRLWSAASLVFLGIRATVPHGRISTSWRSVKVGAKFGRGSMSGVCRGRGGRDCAKPQNRQRSTATQNRASILGSRKNNVWVRDPTSTKLETGRPHVHPTPVTSLVPLSPTRCRRGRYQ